VSLSSLSDLNDESDIWDTWVSVTKLNKIATLFDASYLQPAASLDLSGSCFGHFEANSAPILRGEWDTTALMDPHAFNTGVSASDTFEFIWDTGASISVTPDIDDFVEPVRQSTMPVVLKGLAKGLQV